MSEKNTAKNYELSTKSSFSKQAKRGSSGTTPPSPKDIERKIKKS